MADVPLDGPGLPFDDLREHGLLWLINRCVFHPRGYALALHRDDDGAATGWSVLGHGTEPWNYDASVPEDRAFAAAEAFLAELRRG